MAFPEINCSAELQLSSKDSCAMSDQPKRPRGRPKGSGKDDNPALNQIADLIVRDPSLKATTAIKRVIDGNNPSDIRRLQVKWKKDGDAFLFAARKRQANAASARGAHADIASPFAYGTSLAALQRSTRMIEHVRRAAQAHLDIQKQMKQMFGPAIKVIEDMQIKERILRDALGSTAELQRLSKTLDPLGRNRSR